MPNPGSYLPFSQSTNAPITDQAHLKKVEDYRSGYPSFTALLSAYDPFLVCRQFKRLRARLLLLKQDRLSVLEQRLDEIDQLEPSPLFLGKARFDGNLERKSLLSEIEAGLAEYDQQAQRCQHMLSLGRAQRRDITSLQNWLEGTGCLAREETLYLEHERELVSLAPITDSAVLQLETWVEDRLIRSWGLFRNIRHHNMSNDPVVFIYTGPLIKRIARGLLLAMITLLLLAPVIVCNLFSSTTIRIVVVVVSTIAYLIILSELTKSKTMELVLAAATYATVLIVFVSGNT